MSEPEPEGIVEWIVITWSDSHPVRTGKRAHHWCALL